MVATYVTQTQPPNRREIFIAFGGYQTVIRTFEGMASDLIALSTALGTKGQVSLVGGTATVALPSVAAASSIFLTSQSDGGTPGFLRVSSRVAGTSFTITSSSSTDTSTVAYLVLP